MIQVDEGSRGISIIHGEAPEKWNEHVVRMGGGFYLTTEYASVMRRQGAEPVFFVLKRNGGVRGCALGFLMNQWMRWPLRNICREFQWQTHPVIEPDAPGLLDEFVRYITQAVEKIGVTNIRLHSEDARVSPVPLDGSGFEMISRLEYRIALSRNPNEVLSRISSRKRTYLRSAIKASSLSIQEMPTLDAVEKLIDFQHVSRERRRKRGEDYAVATRAAAERIYEDYIKPGHGRVFLSFKDEQALSGVLLHCWDGRAYYTMSGCSEAGFAENAPVMTVWGVIQQLCADGYGELNMGGVGATATNPDDFAHGLYRFKRSFGGIETVCRTQEKAVPGVRSFISRLIKP